jgi:soluble lytic murein transglycosylase-like protein
LNSVNSDQLTTYAGLVLRNLLDRFGGDVDQAIGAYNGGARNPNPAYAAGVRNVALYARKVLEHAPLPAAKSPAATLPNGIAL